MLALQVKNYFSEIGCKFTQINRIDKWFHKECFRQPYLWILWMMGKNAAALGGEVLWKAGTKHENSGRPPNFFPVRASEREG